MGGEKNQNDIYSKGVRMIYMSGKELSITGRVVGCFL